MVYGNKSKGSIGCPGVFGARICNSVSESTESLVGNGDSFLVNLERNIFAVADSPQWNPMASKEFVVKFNERMEQILGDDFQAGKGQRDIESLKNVLTKDTNQLIEKVDYLSSTTFTCLFVISHMDDLKGLVFHCGDSCVFKVNVGRKHIFQISWTNMNFVGRSKELSQVKIVDIDEDTRFVLCTDGLQALSRNGRHRNLQEILLDSFSRAEVDQIPDLLIDHYGQDIEFPDDIAVVVLDPNKLPGHGEIIIQGAEPTLGQG